MTGELTTCRACGARIEFVRTVKGQRIPLSMVSHPRANLTIDDDGLAVYVKAGEGTRHRRGVGLHLRCLTLYEGCWEADSYPAEILADHCAICAAVAAWEANRR